MWLTVVGYNSQRGPYLIETVIGGGKYTLSYENSDPVEEHGEVTEDNLTEYEPYGG